MIQTVQLEILHYDQGTSDKVYIVELIHNTDRDMYYLYAGYGRRTAKTLTRIVKGNYTRLQSAADEFNELVSNKLDAGYKAVRNGARVVIPGFQPFRFNNTLDADTRGREVKLEPKAPAAIAQPPPEEEFRKLKV